MYLLTAKHKVTFAHQSNNLFLKRPKNCFFQALKFVFIVNAIGIRTTLVVE